MKKFLVIEARQHQTDIDVFDSLEEARDFAADRRISLSAHDSRDREITVADVDESCLADWYEPEDGEEIDWTCCDTYGVSVLESF